MNKFFSLMIGLLLLCSVSQAQYAGIELYPDATMFAYAGNNLTDNLKVDLWANSGAEVATTVGPVLGPFALGVGFSMGVPEDEVDLIFYNADLAFVFDIGPVHWQSYNLYQLGQNDVDDFILARQWLNLGGPFGVVGHNTRNGDEDWRLNWGLYYDFGAIGMTSANKFGVTKNLNGDGMWAVWVLEL
jgi:hypothetical protein